MNRLLLALSALLLSSCALFHHGPSGVDLALLADEIAVVRGDVADLVALATPETQARMAKLDASVYQVEIALRLAATGGPVSDVTSAAKAALSIADGILAGMPDTGDLRLYVGLARIVLRHVAAEQFSEAEEDVQSAPVTEKARAMRAARGG